MKALHMIRLYTVRSKMVINRCLIIFFKTYYTQITKNNQRREIILTTLFSYFLSVYLITSSL